MLTISTETERLSILLARKTGQSLEDTIRLALEECARKVGVSDDEMDDLERQAMTEAALAIAARSAKRALIDKRSEDQILGYDERGIPG